MEKIHQKFKGPVLIFLSALIAGLLSGSLGAYLVSRGGYYKIADSLYYLFFNRRIGDSRGAKNAGIFESSKNKTEEDVSPGLIDKRELRNLSEEELTEKVVSEASPFVVSIIISKEVSVGRFSSPFDDFFSDFPFPFEEFNIPEPGRNTGKKQVVGGGTGFIISSDGLILTNKHVAADDSAEYTVVTAEGKRHKAQVLARDPSLDLAVIKIDALGLKELPLGDSSKLKIGQTVIAIGNALSEFRNTVTKGVISGIGRKVVASDTLGETEIIEGAIQTDAAINPGNSGGPLLDLSGRVIGINTAVSRQGQLIGFAIPINEAKQVIKNIKEKGRIVRPFLGVRYVVITKESADSLGISGLDYGALIVRGSGPQELAIVPGSPADRAGLKENDIILEVEGKRVDQDNSLARLLLSYGPGQEIALKVRSQGKDRFVKVKLEERK